MKFKKVLGVKFGGGGRHKACLLNTWKLCSNKVEIDDQGKRVKVGLAPYRKG